MGRIASKTYPRLNETLDATISVGLHGCASISVEDRHVSCSKASQGTEWHISTPECSDDAIAAGLDRGLACVIFGSLGGKSGRNVAADNCVDGVGAGNVKGDCLGLNIRVILGVFSQYTSRNKRNAMRLTVKSASVLASPETLNPPLDTPFERVG